MTKIPIDKIKRLREETGAPVVEIAKVLEKSAGDMDKSRKILLKYGFEAAAKKQARQVKAGIVESYIHATQLSGSTVVLVCETDFVARTQEFKQLAHEIAMHVTATNPESVVVLMNEPWIRDEKKTIANLVIEYVARLGENIKVQEFGRFEVKSA